MPEPPPPDPRGVKRPVQQFKVYYAATKDPAAPGTWTLAPELKFETLQGYSGPQPNVCILIENKAPTEADGFKSQGSPADFDEGLTGNGETGTLFSGAHITVDSLVKVEANTVAAPSTFGPIFIGVVVKPTYDLGAAVTTWHCEDYRHFMRKAPVYGRYIYDFYAPEVPTPIFVKSFRTTFNEGGKPDRGQIGTTLGEDSEDMGAWVEPMLNRLDQTAESGPADPAMEEWADYWLGGHVWNHIRAFYFFAGPPIEIAHLSMAGFINMPAASETPPGETDPDNLYWLFVDSLGVRVFLSDFAVTGIDTARIISMLLQKAGPYDWTLVPNADGNKSDIVCFNVHEGLGAVAGTPDLLDYTWGDYGQTVSDAAPDVLDGKITRDQTEWFNRGYAVSRRRIVETTLTTLPEQFAEDAPASLVMDASDSDVTAYVAAVAAKNADALKDDKYRNVYRRYRVPVGYNWGTYVFNGNAKKMIAAGNNPGLRRLITQGWSQRGAYDSVPRLAPLDPLVFRSTNGGASWEPRPVHVGVTVLPDCTGILLSEEARTGATPWTWNGDTTTPVAYHIMVTMGLETAEPIDAVVDKTVSSARAREFFFDGGNEYRNAERIHCVLPVNGDGDPTAGKPTAYDTFGTPAVPDMVVNESAALAAEMAYRMEIKNSPNISGVLVLTGLRIDPWPIGHLVGELSVSGEAPNRQAMQLNACIRSFRLDREADTTQYTLDGR
jgi:hypothetical protein